jgi:hypothetical protein
LEDSVLITPVSPYRNVCGKGVLSGDSDQVRRELGGRSGSPDETVNVATDPANAALVEQLGAKLRAGWRTALPSASCE